MVPTFGRPDLLVQCLTSLAHQSLDRSQYEVVVVNDGSGSATEAAVESVADHLSSVKYVELPSNRGPATARNRGVDASTGSLVLFMDDDIVAPDGLLERHLAWHAVGDSSLGVLGLVQWWPELTISPFMHWLDHADVQFRFSELVEGPVDPPWEAFYTCNVSVDRGLLLDIGGFDERFPYPAYEDVELAVRLSTRGFHLEYRPDALAWHARPMTLDGFCARMRKVGEAAVILAAVQPSFPALPPTDVTEPRRWRRWATKALPLVAPALKPEVLRARYFQAMVNDAYREGVTAGQRRLAGGADGSSR